MKESKLNKLMNKYIEENPVKMALEKAPYKVRTGQDKYIIVTKEQLLYSVRINATITNKRLSKKKRHSNLDKNKSSKNYGWELFYKRSDIYDHLMKKRFPQIEYKYSDNLHKNIPNI
tara:strand:+ start:97 stop:447 length:351 start_codon:yes stop_codon:yes gene_type:complete